MNTDISLPYFTLCGGDDNGGSYDGVFDDAYSEPEARQKAAVWLCRLDGEELFTGATHHQVKLWKVNSVNHGDVVDCELIEEWAVGGCRVVAGKRVPVPFQN